MDYPPNAIMLHYEIGRSGEDRRKTKSIETKVIERASIYSVLIASILSLSNETDDCS
jgi:hypothetical protein